MGLLTDLAEPVDNHPHDYLTLEIVDLGRHGDILDEHEAVTFRVAVSKSGPRDVHEPGPLVTGLNSMRVRSNGTHSPWLEVAGWRGTFDHVTDGHSCPDPSAFGVYRSTVSPA